MFSPMKAGHSHDRFPSTQWGVVTAAGGEAGAGQDAAWSHFCSLYWYPLYAYLRRTGRNPQDAQDLTQGFLSALIARGSLSRVHPGEPKFRSYLLAALQHFLNDDRKRASAQKRGGGRLPVSLDDVEAEGRYQLEGVGGGTPELLFERQCAWVVIRRALARLEAEQKERGRGPQFGALRLWLAGTGPRWTADEVREHAGMSSGAFRVGVHRLRRDFARILREELGAGGGGPGELEAELRRMIEVTSGGWEFR